MDHNKVKIVLDWKIPITVKQLHGILLKKSNFHWDSQANLAFDNLKTTVTKALVSALPNFSNPFILENDASRTGIDVVLSQSQHLIAFFSKKLSPQMQKQSA